MEKRVTDDCVSLDLIGRCKRYNKVFNRYPKLMFDKGWLYGVWYCPRPFTKQDFYGKYPLTFLKRVRGLFGDLRPFIHLFSGTVIPEGEEITVDNDPNLNPTHCCPAEHLPFEPDSICCIVADPPYSNEHAKHYSCGKYPPMKKVFVECSRVLKVNSYLLMLHTHLLSVPKKSNLKLRGTVGILSGTNATSRVLAIYSKGGGGAH